MYINVYKRLNLTSIIYQHSSGYLSYSFNILQNNYKQSDSEDLRNKECGNVVGFIKRINFYQEMSSP